jgi:F-type H+-transporting ATPase subunit beta
MAEQNVGKVVAIIGPVLDIQFPEGKLPAIYNAVQIQDEGKETGEPIDVITRSRSSWARASCAASR